MIITVTGLTFTELTMELFRITEDKNKKILSVSHVFARDLYSAIIVYEFIE